MKLKLIVSLIFLTLCNGLVSNPNLFESQSKAKDGYQPNLGNGFIAFDVGCRDADVSSSAGYLFVAGAYSGFGTVTPSKRALIPQSQAWFVDSITSDNQISEKQNWKSSLDVANGIFLNTSSTLFHDGSICEIELSWIVHRSIHELMIFHVNTSSSSSKCLFTLASCNEAAPTSIKEIAHFASPSNDITGSIFETTIPEAVGVNLTRVAVVNDIVPTRFNGGKEITSLSMVLSTSWPGVEGDSLNSTWLIDKFQQISLNSTWPSLYTSHREAWAQIWSSGIEVEGNLTMSAAINASLYYILSSVDSKVSWSVSPGGLAKNSYNGHVFWDCETWMLPVLVMLHPDIVHSFADYRMDRLPAARLRASGRGLPGAMMPWESAVTGADVTPTGNIEGDYEIHVTADIALALRSLWAWTGDDAWFWTTSSAWQLVTDCCLYLAARVSCAEGGSSRDPSASVFGYDQSCESYTFLDVQPPDEQAGRVNDSVYTNAAAAVLLAWAADTAISLQMQPTGIISDNNNLSTAGSVSGSVSVKQAAEWRTIASRLVLPVTTALAENAAPVHPEYRNYAGEAINQADAVLLQFPLSLDMPSDLAFNDLQYYASRTSLPGQSRDFYTGDSSYSIAYLNLLRKNFITPNGEDLKILADEQFYQAFDHIDLTDYLIWHETTDGGHVNFITGAGGFLQNILYGYAGARVVAWSELNQAGSGINLKKNNLQARSTVGVEWSPILPPGGVTSATIRGVHASNKVYSVRWDAQKQLTVTLTQGTELHVCWSSDDNIIQNRKWQNCPANQLNSFILNESQPSITFSAISFVVIA